MWEWPIISDIIPNIHSAQSSFYFSHLWNEVELKWGVYRTCFPKLQKPHQLPPVSSSTAWSALLKVSADQDKCLCFPMRLSSELILLGSSLKSTGLALSRCKAVCFSGYWTDVACFSLLFFKWNWLTHNPFGSINTVLTVYLRNHSFFPFANLFKGLHKNHKLKLCKYATFHVIYSKHT